ncbi:hypothetical protein [Haloactinomyces albus]|uniref:Uncharacterized protein n=1 Tax=Haloactinomyces albus TaxID=1352928 RepID=A0AAE4CPF7_9ACTN|nr:hypothetical protein [Haloactinomyces albus]MDR7304361.1 hypothetical protein [Haloactinomyces albus]
MSRGELLEELVDDAGLFPPTALDMPAAIERHRRDQQAGEPMLTHRFLCPAGRIEQMRAQLVDSDHIAVGLITDHGAEGLDEVLAVIEADPRLSLALLEIPLAKFGSSATAALRALDDVPTSVPAFLEPSAASGVDELLEALSTADGQRRIGAKLRCGGVRAELFPSSTEVAHFITACVAAGLPLKATAGLHQAVRHQDPETGFVHHGYLNLLLAAARAGEGTGAAEVRQVLETEDPGELAQRIGELDRDVAVRARSVLVSYGSCSTSTPPAQAREILGR